MCLGDSGNQLPQCKALFYSPDESQSGMKLATEIHVLNPTDSPPRTNFLDPTAPSLCLSSITPIPLCVASSPRIVCFRMGSMVRTKTRRKRGVSCPHHWCIHNSISANKYDRRFVAMVPRLVHAVIVTWFSVILQHHHPSMQPRPAMRATRSG